MSEFTPWFVNGEKPVRVGVYMVSFRREGQSGKWFSHWNGKNFGPFVWSHLTAEESRAGYEGASHAGETVRRKGSWRGFTERQP